MQKVLKKLKSKAGTSLILALVFMLVCAFVGAVVLASSTANVGRTAKLKEDNQDYLSQRSAATLILDKLFEKDVNGKGDIVLNYSQIATKTTKVTVVNDKRTEYPPEYSGVNNVVFTAGGDNATGKMNQMQRIIYETAVMNYMENNSLPKNPTFIGFRYPDGSTASTTDNFIVTQPCATLFISDPADSTGSTGITARVRFSETSQNTLIIDFGDDSKVSIVIRPRNFSNQTEGTQTKKTISDTTYEISMPVTTSISTTWSRSRAEIVKGVVK